MSYASTVVVEAPVGAGLGQIGVANYNDFSIGASSFTVDGNGNVYILDEINGRVVQFDLQGRFVNNIVYGDAVRAPTGLAVDANGLVYICDAIPEGARIRSFDKEGNLLRDYPVPSWMDPVTKMLVDQDGTLWIEGQGFYPGAPVIEDTIYPWAAVPLGNATTAFAEEDRERKVVPGHLCDSGQTVITYWLTANGPAYAYNLQGERIYEIPEGLDCIDGKGNLYRITSSAPGSGSIAWWNPQGKRIASLNYPGGWTLVQASGTIYSFVWDRSANVYRVTRLQRGQ